MNNEFSFKEQYFSNTRGSFWLSKGEMLVLTKIDPYQLRLIMQQCRNDMRIYKKQMLMPLNYFLITFITPEGKNLSI